MSGENPLKGLLGAFMKKADEQWPATQPEARAENTLPERAEGETYGAEVAAVLAQSNVDISMGITEENPRTVPLGEPDHTASTHQANEGMLKAANMMHLNVGEFPPGAANDDNVLVLGEEDRVDKRKAA